MPREFGPEFDPQPERVPVPEITETKVRMEMTRGSGKGGQKRNKTSNRIQLWWHPDRDDRFTFEQKERIKTYFRETFPSRIKTTDEIYVDAEGERSLEQNKKEALRILNDLVIQALTPEKERRETEPTRGSKERRLEQKEKQGRKKEQRRWREDE